MIRQQPTGKLISLKKSLELNTKIQALLRDEMSKIESLLATNKEKLETLKNIVETEECMNKLKKKRYFCREPKKFAAPYFRDAKKMVPPPNEDTVIKRKNGDINAFLRPPKPWTPAEQKILSDSIAVYAFLSALKCLKRERDLIKAKMRNKILPDEEMDDLEDDLYIVEQKMRLVKRKPLDKLMEELNGNVDWMTISATFMQGTRSPEECERYWNNVLSSDINKTAFSENEDNKLISLAEEYGERNWDAIAASLKAFEKVNLYVKFF